MNPLLTTVATLLTILGIIAGFCMWVLGRILTDKKDKMLLSFEVEKLKDLVIQLKKETDKVDPILSEIEVIKEQIKHL